MGSSCHANNELVMVSKACPMTFMVHVQLALLLNSCGFTLANQITRIVSAQSNCSIHEVSMQLCMDCIQISKGLAVSLPSNEIANSNQLSCCGSVSPINDSQLSNEIACSKSATHLTGFHCPMKLHAQIS